MVPGPTPRTPRLSDLPPPAVQGDLRTVLAALAVPVPDPRWRQRLSAGLSGLHDDFSQHVRVTEGPDGLYAELVGHAPRLARGVHVLLREHGAVNGAFAVLRRRVDLPEVGVEELRERIGHLLRELYRHRRRGADLLHEAYQIDLGGET